MSIMMIGLTSFFVALSGALVPGPLFTITVAESAKRGFISGPLIILGHAILELTLIALLLIGLSPFFKRQGVIIAISLLGGAMLVIMGAMMIRDARHARISVELEGEGSGMHPVIAGIVGSISNPYWTIWWATIGLGYLVSAIKLGILGIVVFFIGHITADLVWYSLISFTVAKGKKFMGDKGYRILLYICGIFLVVFGIWFISGAT
ncbi:MAG: LysE family transporter [Nitrospirota bacterium]|nr:MAG: LysE family transporter [Nitrospirota bacterium]